MAHTVPREQYLAHARDLTEAEFGLIREFEAWLPEKIIDCHAHSNLPEHVLHLSEQAYRHMLSTFPCFTIEESKEWHRLFHPGKAIRSLRFAKTFRGVDHRAANEYLFRESPPDDRVALYGLPDDPEYTIRMLAHPRVSALKMYYSYLEPPATDVYEYFPKDILREAQTLDVPIILHPPVRITKCLDQILRLTDDFPKLRVCIAHLGLTKEVIPGLEDAYFRLSERPQIVMDTSLVPSAAVVRMALVILGPDRIMYGSDEPLHLIRSAAYEHPERGQRIVTKHLYHWADPEEHAAWNSKADGVPHAHWQCLTAIRRALEISTATAEEIMKRRVFHDNAASFYGF